MNSKTNVVRNPPFRARECAIIIMTTFVLVGVCGLLSTTFLSSVTSMLTGAAAPDHTQLAKHDPRPDGQKSSSSAKINVAPTPAKGTQGTQAEPQEPPARLAAPNPPAPQTGLVVAPSSIGPTILTVAVVFALAIAAGLIFVFCFFALLRRHSRDFGALIRIEYTGAPPLVVGPFTASSLGVAVPQAAESNGRWGNMSAETVAAHTAKAADFGDSFASERQLLDERAKRQDTAVLQQLCENNLKLQADIGLTQRKQEGAALEEAAI